MSTYDVCLTKLEALFNETDVDVHKCHDEETEAKQLDLGQFPAAC